VLFYLYNMHKFPKNKIFRKLLLCRVNAISSSRTVPSAGAKSDARDEIGLGMRNGQRCGRPTDGRVINRWKMPPRWGWSTIRTYQRSMMGLIQIPCIERNAMAAMRSIDHCSTPCFRTQDNVPFDAVLM
jgi:L-serine dehydratase